MVSSKKPESSQAPRIRTDGRKSLLVYLDAGLIKDLKKAALDDETNVYELVEDAARTWLAARAKRVAAEPSK